VSKIKQPRWSIDPITHCWNWLLWKSDKGYGTESVLESDGKIHTRKAHRVMYERRKRKIPTGYEIDHTCNNRGCVNPKHLKAVPPRTNLQRSGKCKLTIHKVQKMRALRRAGKTYRELSAIYKMNPDHIREICLRLYWKDVP